MRERGRVQVGRRTLTTITLQNKKNCFHTGTESAYMHAHRAKRNSYFNNVGYWSGITHSYIVMYTVV